ncbi:MAG: response regulator transcription factor [Pseudomonadota bacterium]
MSPAQAVLVVEGETPTRATLATALRTQSYEVIEATSGGEGLLSVASCTPKIVLLGAELPDMRGLEMVRRIRAQSDVPIIVMSAREDEKSLIAALDSGANDYVTKPVRYAVLLARMRVQLRPARPARRRSAASVVGALRIDPIQKRAWVRGIEVPVTVTEFRLLSALMHHAGRVVTHQQLLRQVWGATHARDIQYLRVYMKQLRAKIETEPRRPEFFLTAPGVGYRLNVTD